MTKQTIENNLGEIWNTWLKAEYDAGRLSFICDLAKEYWFSRYDEDYHIEEFQMCYQNFMSLYQLNFSNHLLQVMVEIQNHDNIEESWVNKKRATQ